MDNSDKEIKLYKYKAFNSISLRAIIENEIYYAKPNEFNDPLDCNPRLQNDLKIGELAELARKMLEFQLGTDKAASRFQSIKRSAAEYGDYRVPNSEARKELEDGLLHAVRSALDDEFKDMGVLCLSSSWDSILMWSHYGDQHRGLCIEYAIDKSKNPSLTTVAYLEDRSIKTSDLWRCKIKNDPKAQSKIIDGYFYTKATDWEYEGEWRDISDKSGRTESGWKITGIYLGYRCETAVKTALRNILSANPDIELWDVEPHSERFQLNRYPVEERDVYPLRPPNWMDEFLDNLEDVDEADEPTHA